MPSASDLGPPPARPARATVLAAVLCLLAALGLASVPAVAAAPPGLDGDSYARLLAESPEFRQADQELNRVWRQVLARTLPEKAPALRREQRHWLSREREAQARRLSAGGMAPAQAYALATRRRVEHLRALLESLGETGQDDFFARGMVRRVRLRPWGQGVELRLELSRYCSTGFELLDQNTILPRVEVMVHHAALAAALPRTPGLRLAEGPRGVRLVLELERAARLRAVEGYHWLGQGTGPVEYFLRLVPIVN